MKSARFGASMLAVSLLLIAFPCTATAGPFIDTFNAGNFLSTRTTVGSTPATQTGLPVADVIGGTRSSVLTATSLAIPGLDSVTATVVASVLDYSSSTGAKGTFNLLYDANGAAGGLNADFTNVLSIDLPFLGFDFGGSVAMPVTITLNDGANTATLTQSLTAPGAQTKNFLLSSFAGIGSLNKGSIDSVNIFFDPQLSQDFRVDFIGTTTQAQVIPEPASFMLWAFLGLTTLWGCRRRLHPAQQT